MNEWKVDCLEIKLSDLRSYLGLPDDVEIRRVFSEGMVDTGTGFTSGDPIVNSNGEKVIDLMLRCPRFVERPHTYGHVKIKNSISELEFEHAR